MTDTNTDSSLDMTLNDMTKEHECLVAASLCMPEEGEPIEYCYMIVVLVCPWGGDVFFGRVSLFRGILVYFPEFLYYIHLTGCSKQAGFIFCLFTYSC